MSTWVFIITVIIIKNGGLTDGHTDDRAAMLVSASRAPVAVTALRSEKNRRDVMDLVGGLSASALLGYTTTLAPSVTGIQDKGKEEN